MAKAIEYVAVVLGYDTHAVYGTLEEILEEIESEERDPMDYKFFPLHSEVKMKYERKLVLAEV